MNTLDKSVQIKVDELDKLFRFGVQGNGSGFALLARRLVSSLKKESPEAAGRLAETLATGGVHSMRGISSNSVPVDADSRKGLLNEVQNVVLEQEPVWASEIQKMLSGVVIERKSAARLIEAGLEPIRAILFKGPPGVGKTLAAYWLARELELPLLTLDLATVMSSLLGKTGANIKSVVDYARSFPCILLLDEFDSVAKKRDDDADVGELKRLVTVLLQAIDGWPSTSLLVAATNHPDLLDPAVWRRFDLSIDFGNPDAAAIAFFLEREGVSSNLTKFLTEVLHGQSFAVLRKVLMSARKQSVLNEQPFDQALLEAAMSHDDRGQKTGTALRNLQILHLAGQSIPHRRIAEQLGVSHPTVGRVLKQFRGEK